MSTAEFAALEDAIQAGDAEDVHRCLVASASKIDLNSSTTGTSGNTLLHLACEKVNLESVIPILLACGASVNATNNNLATPLARAVRAGNEGIAMILVSHGASLNMVNTRGLSPLHHANASLCQKLETLRDEYMATMAPTDVADPIGQAPKQRRAARPVETHPPSMETSGAAVPTSPLRPTPAAAPPPPPPLRTPPNSAEPDHLAASADPVGPPVPTNLIMSCVQRTLRRLPRGPADEPEAAMLARLRSHFVTLLAVLHEAGIQSTPATAAVVAPAILNTRSYNAGSDLGRVLDERLVSELKRVLTHLRRLGPAGETHGTWGVTLLPMAMQVELLLPDPIEVAREEARNEAADAAAAAAEAAEAAAAAAGEGEDAKAAMTAALVAATEVAALRHQERLAWWQERVSTVKSALVREMVRQSIPLHPVLCASVPELHRGYATLPTGTAIAHGAIEIHSRMASTTRPLLLKVDWAAAGPAPAPAPSPDPLSPPAATSTIATSSLSDAGAPPEKVFYKEGDDLLQDVGTTMLLHEMNAYWAAEGCDWFTPVYAVYPLPDLPSAGFLECLPRAQPVASVDTFRYSRCLHTSCVGSMVACYVLGLADRHQDNMLLLDGQVFAHIDFGFVAGSRPWPFDTGPFPIPQAFEEACGEHWHTFLDDVVAAYEIVQRRREELKAVARALATPLVGSSADDAPAEGLSCFATFLDKTLDRPASEVRQLAAEGPTNWSTRVKEATYRGGHFAGKKLRDLGVPV